jgi:large subunit ribosomal protein L18
MSRLAMRYRRKREGRTDYRLRLSLLKSGKPRMVIRKALKNILLQIVEYNPDGDKILLSVHSNSLKRFGWDLHRGNVPAAYLTGLFCGKLAVDKKIEETNLDLGLFRSVKGSVQYAAVKGIMDSGLKIKCSKKVLPAEERLEGKNISEQVHKQFLATKKKILEAKNNGRKE